MPALESRKPNIEIWHDISWQETLDAFHVHSSEGLSEKEARELQEKYGENKLPEEKISSRWKVFLEQFKNPLVFILLISGVATLFLQYYTESAVIWGAVLLNSFLGYLQEFSATKALGELKKVLRTKAK